jgi:N-acetylglucosamine kinase-like BadF-type ATPase
MALSTEGDKLPASKGTSPEITGLIVSLGTGSVFFLSVHFCLVDG